jgi:hypothetical protein
MSRGERIGWTLVAVDALTTIPLVLQLLSDDKLVATLPSFASARQFHGSRYGQRPKIRHCDEGQRFGMRADEKLTAFRRVGSANRSFNSIANK